MNAPGMSTSRLPLSQLSLTHSFASLPPSFYTRLQPTPMPAPYLVCGSVEAATLIGLDPAELATAEFIETFAGNRLLQGSQALAAVYSGHQFGIWAGQLGDGRAILLGEVAAATETATETATGTETGTETEIGAGTGATTAPSTLEIQLKGAGMTPYSRMGDGRAVLRSSIREYLCSEAMAGLGIPTSRALCVIGSDQLVMRETPETSAVTTRLAPSFIRFGSFEHWYHQGKNAELKILADYVIARFYPELQHVAKPYQALLAEVTRRTAHLVAQWQAVGFMHGVLNTDNMSILGLTIDYGPFGFMEAFDAAHICNHSDHQGRYAYAMQPKIGHWNCHALGQVLLPLIGEIDDAQAALDGYADAYQEKMNALLHAKLGLQTSLPEDSVLIDAMFKLLQDNHADFTLFFRTLGELQRQNPSADTPLRDLFIDRAAFDAWAVQYRLRLELENSNDAVRRLAMHAINPKYILRNYLAQVAIEKAQNKDFSEIARLQKILEHPFDEQVENARYAALPPDWASQLEVSCSS